MQLAAMVGVSKETIYKIEAGKQGITPKQSFSFAEVFGIAIDDLYEGGPAPAGFNEEAAHFDPDAASFESRITLDEHQSWYIIKESHLDQIGYFDGTPVIVDISKGAMDNLRSGDAVIASRYAAKGKNAETIVRQYISPSLLITNSLRNNLPSLNLDADDVRILGVVVYPRPRGRGVRS